MKSMLTTTSPRIHYDLHGSSGPHVVLVMGLGMRGSVWKPQTDELSRDHRIVTMDHRGVGESPDLPSISLSMRDLASDVMRVVDEAKFRRPHLVGVSMGGMIAQEAAIRNPERFASLTLIATHPGRSPTTVPPIRTIRSLVHAFTGTAPERRKAFFDLLYTDEFVAHTDENVLLARAKAQLGSPAPRAVLAAQFGAILRHDTSSRLHRLTMPVLLVRPDKDILVRPVGMDRLARRIPHAEMLRFSDAGHGVTFEKARELNDALRGFFARAR